MTVLAQGRRIRDIEAVEILFAFDPQASDIPAILTRALGDFSNLSMT
jgi:hypothetical protein